jgi:cyclophilin family peptidyl-prolyl cis-trans isomerase
LFNGFKFLSVGACSLSVGACSRNVPSAPEAGADATPSASSPDPVAVLAGIARAEDRRRLKDLPPEVQRSHDPLARRAATRALARILDPDDTPLLRALEDDDDGVVAWAAFGLGESCKGHEVAHVQALAARLASFGPERETDHFSVQAVPALLRALGRCGGDLAEQTLGASLRRGGPTAEAAAYALGDMAGHGSLSIESRSALLDAAQDSPPLGSAFYALSRDGVGHDAVGRAQAGRPKDVEAREVAAERQALRHPGPERIFALRALGQTGDRDALPELTRALASDDFTPPERAEAAHALGHSGAPGQAALADALDTLVPARADGLLGDRFGVLLTALGAVSDEPPTKMLAALWAVARLEEPAGTAPPLARRVSSVRCAAAVKLARGVWDADILRGCDVGDGEARERAVLASLDRGQLVKARRAAWLALASSPHVRVREAAIELASRHPELGAAALPVIARGLSASEPGVVATAATFVQAHPDRAFVLAESERRAALDPSAPPPPERPARELDKAVAAGLRAALAHVWSEDLVETRGALVEAGLSAGVDEGKAFARAACTDQNATVRARAAKALAAAGEKDATCTAPDAGEAAGELGHELTHGARVVFETDAGSLRVRFDPALAPVAATRFVALARSGFYTGIVIHRVVPGFVVQLGDRGGDGYGGSGELLRCETSPVPFGALDVGVALAGRDTGSSQIFVTLARSPRLDGQYAWVGHADGDWNAVAEGDLVRAVRVVDAVDE